MACRRADLLFLAPSPVVLALPGSGASSSRNAFVHPHSEKHVAFCEETMEEVEVDEWGRTPADTPHGRVSHTARKLFTVPFGP
ncbi:hypothetical protein ID866_12150 [Astraeus odoratus]|nr:hypothetical protein ID866_12150 [Astraeus odoratus]